jgi:hypothetical protein
MRRDGTAETGSALNALDGAGRLTESVKPPLRTGAVAFREWNQLAFQEPRVDIEAVSLLATRGPGGGSGVGPALPPHGADAFRGCFSA